MVAAISTVMLESKVASLQGTPENSTGISRPPLLPSERENGIKAAGVNRRSRPRGREIPSRYMSPSCSSSSSSSTASTRNSSSTPATTATVSSSSVSRRCPSPIIARQSTNNSNPKRSQSADRRRSTTPRPAASVNAGEVSAATKLLVTSTRSLSVSFQGESYSLPISKTKAVNSPSSNGGRKVTPERRRCTPLRGKVDGGSGDQQVEGSKQVDQQLWPTRSRQVNAISRSLDCSNSERKEILGSNVAMRSLHESLIDNSRRSSFDGILNLDSSSAEPLGALNISVDVNSVNGSSVPSDVTASDTDSVSSGSTSGPHESNNGHHSGPRGIIASARFWQETNMRLRRLQDPGSVSSISPQPKIPASKLTQSRKFTDGSLMSPRIMSSPTRGPIRSASPSRLMTPSPVRGTSPSKIRSPITGSLNSSFCDTPSVLSYIVDVRRGKVGENRIIDAHQLRLLYNRHLQWRFVNARTDIALLVQKQSAEKNLWNAWITITGLRDSVKHKRAQLQLLKQKLKLTSILKGQVNYLDEWSLMDKDHSSALQGAIESLKASTLRLPVVGAAIIDVQSVKEAVSSAVDVMQAMASSMRSLLTKVEEVNSLVSELVNVAAKEGALLGQCKDVLSALATLEVKDCSLRTHVLQLNRLQLA